MLDDLNAPRPAFEELEPDSEFLEPATYCAARVTSRLALLGGGSNEPCALAGL
jgi:hypothetical protein